MYNRFVSKWAKRSGWLILAALLLSLTAGSKLGLASTPAAAPGAQIFSASGQLSAGSPGENHIPSYPVVANTTVNLKLEVSLVSGAGAGIIKLIFTDGSNQIKFNQDIRVGETLWTTVTLTPGNNKFSLQNTSGGSGPTLQYKLWLYEVANVPFNWSGTSDAASTWRSQLRLYFPSSALYTFAFGKSSGAFQFLLDNTHIQKTVGTNGQVSYYVPAGFHNLTIQPDPAFATTQWSLNISGPGATSDSLPYTKSGGALGGAGAFDEEWLPLNLAAATPANVQLKLTGSSADYLELFRVSSGAPVGPIKVYGGETVWWSENIPSGLSRLHLLANSSGPLSYELKISARPTAPANWSWAGKSNKDGRSSVMSFQTSTAGLYDLNYGLVNGRYQFKVDANSNYIQKTATTTGTVRYFLPAGAHTLTVIHDSGQGATWSIGIIPAGQVYDSLPYRKTGGQLGGAGNDYSQEWLPLNSTASGPVNFKLSLPGNLADGLTASLYQGNTVVYTTPVVYGGETFWWTANLGAGVNKLNLAAKAGNGAPLSYDLTVYPIPSIGDKTPYTWNGLSKGSGVTPGSNSKIRLRTPVKGTYHVEMNIPVGFASVSPADAGLTSLSAGAQIDYYLPLSAGDHLFQVSQSADYITSTWTVTVSLTSSDAQFTYLPFIIK